MIRDPCRHLEDPFHYWFFPVSLAACPEHAERLLPLHPELQRSQDGREVQRDQERSIKRNQTQILASLNSSMPIPVKCQFVENNYLPKKARPFSDSVGMIMIGIGES